MTQGKREQAQAELTPGRIIYAKVPLIDHDKYLVILTKDPLRAMFINSEIHALKDTAEKKDLQIKTDGTMHPFLKQTSYIDCTSVVTALSKENAVTQIVDNQTRVKGKIRESERAAILAAVGRARELSKVQKDLIRDSLELKPARLAAPARS